MDVRQERYEGIPLPGFDEFGYNQRMAATGHSLREHDHGACLEILYISRGNQPYVIEDQRFDLRGGECIFTFPEERHSSGDERLQRAGLTWLILDLQASGFLGLPEGLGRSLAEALLHVPQRHFLAHEAAVTQLEELRLQLKREEDPLAMVRVASLLQAFCCDLIDAATCAAATRRSPPVRRALELIERELHGALPVAMLARHADLSPGRFATRFRAEVGMPPSEWVLKRKLERARELLQEGCAVTECALRLGFSSSQYFATVFKRHVGDSPSAWIAAQDR